MPNLEAVRDPERDVRPCGGDARFQVAESLGEGWLVALLDRPGHVVPTHARLPARYFGAKYEVFVWATALFHPLCAADGALDFQLHSVSTGSGRDSPVVIEC